MLNCKHMIKASDLPKTIMATVGPPKCPWCEIERLEAELDQVRAILRDREGEIAFLKSDD